MLFEEFEQKERIVTMTIPNPAVKFTYQDYLNTPEEIL